MQRLTIQTCTSQLQYKIQFKAIQYGTVLRSAIKQYNDIIHNLILYDTV